MSANRSLSRLPCAAVLLSCLAVVGAPVVAQTGGKPPVVESTPAPQPDDSEVGAVVSVQLQSRPALTLSGSAEWGSGLPTITASLEKLRAEMGRIGLQPGGRPMAVFTETDDQGFKFTAMLPLAERPANPPALQNNAQLGETPAGKAMKFEHRGSYDDIDTSYEAITAYLDEKGLEAQNLFIEEYLTTPKGADDTDLEVDIYVFLK